MSDRKVEERDFRKDIYRYENPEDYECRSDGTIARKDRWEKSVKAIGGLVKIDTRNFEIDSVIEAVEKLAVHGE